MKTMMDDTKSTWVEYELGELLSYEQPTPYIVESTDYNDKYKTPVLTAGKSFILGYTNETNGVYTALPVIIFDDFTTASQYVNFEFKVKSSAMKILTPNTELVLPKFIYYRMQIIQFDHSTHKRYWIQQYSKIKVSIPPIPVQEQIVAKIEELFSELDNGVETLQKTKQQLAVYRQAVLKAAFGEIAQDAYRPLRTVLSSSPQNGLYKPKTAYGSGTRILRIDGFYDGRISDDYDFKRLELSESEIKQYQLNKWDLVINRVNSMPYLGKCALVRDLAEVTVYESNMMRMRLDENTVNPEYVTHYLSSFIGRKELTKNAKQAVNQASINQTDVGNALIPVPESLEEQRNVVSAINARMSVCDNIEKTVDTALQQAEAMRQSILKQAFEGKL